MELTKRHAPSFSVARLTLRGGEKVRVEGGSMMAMSNGVTLEAHAHGGKMKSFKRSVAGGETLFLTTYTAPAQGGYIDVASQLPGDVSDYSVTEGKALFMARGAWLANDSSVEIDTQWAGFKNLFGSEGGFVIRAEGEGHAVFACYGAMEVVDLKPDETFTINTGHMVAYEESVRMELHKATGGIVQSFVKSHEGFLFTFFGPGKVWTQTRSQHALVHWINAAATGSGGTAGFVGGMVGGYLSH